MNNPIRLLYTIEGKKDKAIKSTSTPPTTVTRMCCAFDGARLAPPVYMMPPLPLPEPESAVVVKEEEEGGGERITAPAISEELNDTSEPIRILVQPSTTSMPPVARETTWPDIVRAGEPDVSVVLLPTLRGRSECRSRGHHRTV